MFGATIADSEEVFSHFRHDYAWRLLAGVPQRDPTRREHRHRPSGSGLTQKDQ
jgi:ABC-type dipeptide/oligopeptide/nickel transport system ATPase component